MYLSYCKTLKNGEICSKAWHSIWETSALFKSKLKLTGQTSESNLDISLPNFKIALERCKNLCHLHIFAISGGRSIYLRPNLSLKLVILCATFPKKSDVLL